MKEMKEKKEKKSNKNKKKFFDENGEKRYTFMFLESEKEEAKFLYSQTNKRQYLLSLIRRDMQRDELIKTALREAKIF